MLSELHVLYSITLSCTRNLFFLKTCVCMIYYFLCVTYFVWLSELAWFVMAVSYAWIFGDTSMLARIFFAKSFTPCSKVKDPPLKSGSAFYLCTLGQKLSACSNFFEVNPSLSSQQHVVYCFKCNLCVTGYDRYICHHANQYIDEHNWCAMGKREQEKHDTNITILASKVLIQRSQKR